MADNNLVEHLHELYRRAEVLQRTLAEVYAEIRQVDEKLSAERRAKVRALRKSNRRAPPGIKAVTTKGRTYYYDRLTGNRVPWSVIRDQING